MSQLPKTIRYGTSSWSEKSWVGPFYPPGAKPGDFLTHYAREFDTVEADVTWYRIPDRAMVERWREKTPPGFELAAKFPRSIVHGGEGARPDPERVLVREHVEDDLRDFLGAMDALGDRCGPLLLQFPFFNRTVLEEREFLARLDAFLGALPADFRYGVEVRNKGWIGPRLLDVLRRHHTAFVLVDLAYMPHPADVAAKLNVVTTDFVYGRLIGDRKNIDSLTTTFDRIVVDQTPRLKRWVELLRESLGRVPKVYVYGNNHYAGHGPETMRMLRSMVEEG